jgi:hypothetical protein
MPQLEHFDDYGGFFPASACIRAALAYSGRSYSEALLAGIAGGISFGYFSFAYEGYDPQANILTRNTFGNYGWDALAERLGLEQDVQHSTSLDKGRRKLEQALEEGRAPMVWADMATLGYESSEFGEQTWMMTPVIVTAYEQGGDALIADRARRAIRVPAERLDRARGRVKKDRFRLITLDLPSEPDLASAVRGGLRDCIGLYLEGPPKGSAENFGTRGLNRWIERLTKPGAKESWAKVFPAGRPFFSGLTTAFKYALLYWEDDTLTADRLLFAKFLEEAAAILQNSTLIDTAGGFREQAERWTELGEALLPSDVPILNEARGLLVERHCSFLSEGNRDADRLSKIDQRIDELRSEAESELSDAAAYEAITEGIAEKLAEIRDAESLLFAELSETIGVRAG